MLRELHPWFGTSLTRISVEFGQCYIGTIKERPRQRRRHGAPGKPPATIPSSEWRRSKGTWQKPGGLGGESNNERRTTRPSRNERASLCISWLQSGGGGGGYAIFMLGRSSMSIWYSSYLTLASLQYVDGVCRVFNDQADIACTKREAP